MTEESFLEEVYVKNMTHWKFKLKFEKNSHLLFKLIILKKIIVMNIFDEFILNRLERQSWTLSQYSTIQDPCIIMYAGQLIVNKS